MKSRCWVMAWGLLSVISSAGQAAEVAGSVDDRIDVTAVTVTVEVDEFGWDLSTADFEVLEDGRPQTLLSVERAAADGDRAAGPWQIVLYLDRRLSDRRSLRRAAAALAAQASQLVALGEVQILAAETELEQLLKPTRNVATLRDALKRLAKKGTGRGELLRLRRQFLRDATETDSSDQLSRIRSVQSSRGSTAPTGTPGGSSQDQLRGGREVGARGRMLARGAAVEEARLVDHQLDLLSRWVSRQRFPGPRALILVNDGFDLDPRDFYLRLVPERDESEISGLLQELSMGARQERLSRLLAAQGWTVLAVATGEGQGGLPGDSGSQHGANAAANSGIESTKQLPKFLLAHGLQPLTSFAEASGGVLLTSEDLLAEAVASLGRRWRLTYQVERQPDGRIHEVEVRLRELGGEVRAPLWIASETLEEIAFERARNMVEGNLEGGELSLQAAIFFPSAREENYSGGPRRGTLAVRADLAPLAALRHTLQTADVRVSLAVFYPERDPFTHHQVVRSQDLSLEGTWDFSTQLNLPADAARVVVVVEELASGVWGAAAAPLMTRRQGS